MLREIQKEELLKVDPDRVMVIQNGSVTNLHKLFCDARFLIDDSEEPKPKKAPGTKNNGRPSNEERVLKAWNRGERTVDEIVKLTGLTKQTVLKYIPE